MTSKQDSALVEPIDIERGIRIAVWNTCRWQGRPQEVAQSFIRHLFDDEPTMARAMRNLTRLTTEAHDAGVDSVALVEKTPCSGPALGVDQYHWARHTRRLHQDKGQAMTPDDLRAARKSLGLTQHALAEALRMGKWGFQSIAKWEKGEIPVPGPVAVAIELMLRTRTGD